MFALAANRMGVRTERDHLRQPIVDLANIGDSGMRFLQLMPSPFDIGMDRFRFLRVSGRLFEIAYLFLMFF